MSTFVPAQNIVTETGEQFIPPTQRPDGTWRKARRVKEGYVPQEEVPLYESKGKQNAVAKSKRETVVTNSGQVAVPRSIPGLFIIPDEKEKKTNKKIKNKLEEINRILESAKLDDTQKDNRPAKDKQKNQSQPSPKSPSNQEATDPAKKLKNLKKRLREVEALEEKLNSGAIAKPEAEQLAKIKRKGDLLVQIYELEKQVQ